MLRGNEDWRNRWGHRNLRQWKIQSGHLSPAKRNLVPTCQADATVQTSAFKIAIEGRGPAIGKCMLS